MMTIHRHIVPSVVAILLVTTTACGLYQKYETPTDSPIINDYSKALQQPQDSSSLGNLGWREVFTDPLLQSYIEQALANNTDLQNAKINVDIAQARLQGAKLSYLPSVEFGPNGSGTKLGSSSMSWGWQLPLTVSWQVDIFGQITNNKRSAESAVIQSDAYRQAVQSQLIASVASCYYTLVSLQNELDIYNENSLLWAETVKMMKDMKESGKYTEVAVVQAVANFESVLASIPDIKLDIIQASNTMSLLLNTKPQQWPVTAHTQLAMPASVQDGVPMSYLAARPDVCAAEQSFAQAYYATNVARANFYPQLTITGTGAYGTLVGGSVISPAQWLLNLAGSLTAPIFKRGQNIATLKAAKLQQQQALNSFEYSILNAATEVDNALASIHAYQDKQVHVERETAALVKAVQYNRDLMDYGTTTYLEIITAQQSLLQAQLQLENVRVSSNLAIIELYQTLGGGR